jgi:hypothetical protein
MAAFPVTIDYQVTPSASGVVLLGSETIDLDGYSSVLPDPDPNTHNTPILLFDIQYSYCNAFYGCNDGVTGNSSNISHTIISSTLVVTVSDGTHSYVYDTPFSFQIDDQGYFGHDGGLGSHYVGDGNTYYLENLGAYFSFVGSPEINRGQGGTGRGTTSGTLTGIIHFDNASSFVGLSLADFTPPPTDGTPEPSTMILAALAGGTITLRLAVRSLLKAVT